MGTPIHRGYHSAPKDRTVPYRNTINKQLQCAVEKENQVQVQRKAIQHRDWLAQHSLACSAESRCKQIPGQPESKAELQETTGWRMRWTGTGSERPWWVQQVFITHALSHEEPPKGLKPSGKIRQILLQQSEELCTKRKKGKQKGS